MIIDVFSKYGWSIPLKTKTGKEVASALRTIFKKNKPAKLWEIKDANFITKMFLSYSRKTILVYTQPTMMRNAL